MNALNPQLRAAGGRCGRWLSLVNLLAALWAQPGPATMSDGFALPQLGHVFTFPRDHGAHPEFRLEWWYLTGHLFADGGSRYGFQATFFRQTAPDKSTQLHLAHMALLDVQTGRFLHQERLNRDGWDASASNVTLALRNGPWSLRSAAREGAPPRAEDRSAAPAADPMEPMTLLGGIRSEVSFALALTPTKPLVRFGVNGYSRKGAELSAASYYLTFPRLAIDGQLTLGAAAPIHVRGEAWMDHEISSSQLGRDQVGWDWVSIQFNDTPSRELMLYRMRLRDGTTDPASVLQWVSGEGQPTARPFSWEVLSEWKSATTGATYPARVRIATTDLATGAPVSFTLVPLAAEQELSGRLGGIAYWEGACRVFDAAGREVGSAYMELTGYARPLKF